MAEVREFLDRHLRGKASPFLFVGSRRYTDGEDWVGLLRHFAAETGRPYEYFRASAEGDLPTVASRMAEVFHEVWWADDRYAGARAEWADKLTTRQSALKVEVARHFSMVLERLPESGALAEELTLFRAAVVDGIITTNFDPLLEHLFPDFRVFVGQDQMLFSSQQAIGEIYKIHGSYDLPDSLVLTAEDYTRFDERNAYLAAKLLTTFVEHPVIFLGYRLGDRNVQSVLRSIANCLTQDNIDELRDRLVFVQWQPDADPEIGPHSIVIEGFQINVVRIRVPDFVEVFEALANLSRTFPARLLRRLKEHVYALVLHDDPEARLFVADIDGAETHDIDVVFGVGIKEQLGHTGYVGLDRWDLIDDVVDDCDNRDPVAVVEVALPRILRGPGNVPTYKYLNGADRLTKLGTIRKSADVDPRIEAMAEKHRGGSPAGRQYQRVAPARLQGMRGIRDLEEKRGAAGVLSYGTCMPAANVSIEELRSFLQRNRHLRDGGWEATQYAKLARYLDWLEYGRNAQPEGSSPSTG